MKYCFFVFLLCCFACNKTVDTTTAEESNSDGRNNPTQQEDDVQPLTGTLPIAVFTDMRLIAENKPSNSIISYLGHLINATPKDASIYMSVYLFKKEPGLVTAIRNADKRGVHVHVELDRSDDYNDPIVAKLSAISKDIDIVSIYNDIKSYAINHNKFAIFSEVISADSSFKKVVFTSSENWTPGTEKKIQNAVALSNAGLYDAYLRYWKDMKKHADHDMISYNYRVYDDLAHGIKAMFYPKRKDGNYFGPNPIIQILDQITDPASTTIQIAMAFWHDHQDIIDKLTNLMGKGAKVEIVVRSGQPDNYGLENIAADGAFVKMFNYTNVPDVKQIKLHSKTMLIRGEWNGHKTNVIITGSLNYNYGGLRTSNNNNLILSSYHFKHPEIFQRFEDNFNAMKVLPGVCCVTGH